MELSAAAHRLLTEPAPSRRAQTPYARKRRHSHLTRELAAAVGIREPTAPQAALLRTAVSMQMHAETLQAQVIAGELASADELIRLASEIRRVARALGIELKSEPPKAAPWWERPPEDDEAGADG
jgi:hypothetical protein